MTIRDLRVDLAALEMLRARRRKVGDREAAGRYSRRIQCLRKMLNAALKKTHACR